MQLWSVIPFAVATPITGKRYPPLNARCKFAHTGVLVLVAYISDRLKLRGVAMLCVLPIAIVGYAVIANVKAAEARFAMTCLMAVGMYCAVPPILVWNSNNSAGHYKRATTSAVQLAVANAGGFISSTKAQNPPLEYR